MDIIGLRELRRSVNIKKKTPLERSRGYDFGVGIELFEYH